MLAGRVSKRVSGGHPLHCAPMQILHVEAGRHLYGGARQVLYLMEGLEKRGIESVLACPEGSAIAEAATSCHVAPLAMGGDLDVGLVPRLRMLINDCQPDLVHVHSRRGADWLGGMAARGAGVPAIITRRVDNPERRITARPKYAMFRKVVAISEAIRAMLRRAGVSDRRIAVVPSAVPLPENPDPVAARAALDIEGDGPIVGMVAQFIPRKGHDVLLQALPSVLSRHPDVRVLLFGRGAEEAKVRDHIRQAGWEDQVRLMGFRPDVSALLSALDLLVHPALREGLGLAVLEASAAGVPVIAARAGGLPEICRDGETGLLVPPGDPDALAGAMNLLLDDAGLRGRLAEGARAFVGEQHSVDGMVVGNIKVYRDVLETMRMRRVTRD